jgi:hypothetical protein
VTLSDASPNAVGHWALDEASGTRVDSVGSSDLTDNNTVGSAAGLFSLNAADFERSNSEYLNVADNAALSMANIDFFIRALVNVESYADISIVQKAGSNDLEFDLGTTASAAFRFRVSSAAGFTNLTTVSTSSGYPTGTWILLHAWHDATNNIIGIETNAATGGVGELFTQSYSSGSYNSGADFRIGGYSDFSEYFDGLAQDVVVLKNYILDSTERDEDYNSGSFTKFADWGGGGGGATVTPTTASLTITTFAPTVLAPRLVTPTTASLALTSFAPTASTPVVCTPTTLALAITEFAPTVVNPQSATPTTASLTLTTFAPTVTVSGNQVVTPTTAALTLTTYAPEIGGSQTATPTTAALSLSTFAPAVSTPRVAIPTTATLSLATFAPTILTPVVCTPSTLALVLTAYAPSVSNGELEATVVGTWSNVIKVSGGMERISVFGGGERIDIHNL